MNLSALRQTVRGRLLLLAVVIELLMLTILVANSQRLLHGAMSTQARLQAEQMHPVLQAALTAPMAQRDYATVQAVIDESRSAGGVDYITVVDASGTRVASNGWPDGRPLPPRSVGFPLLERGSTARYDVVAPIVYFKQPLGTLHFGLNLTQILVARRTLLIQGASIAAIELVLSTIILFSLGHWITRHLTTLTAASIQVASGTFPPNPVPEGGDDVGRLGAAFNTMSRVISDRVRDLNEQAGLLKEEVARRRNAQELLLVQQEQLETLNRELEERVADEVKKNRDKEQTIMQSEKMASLGQLAAGVAHEINNPMGYISCNLRALAEYFDQIVQFDLLLREKGEREFSRGTLESIATSRKSLDIDDILSDGVELITDSLEGAKKVSKIVQDLKSFSRVDTPDHTLVELNSCVESALTIVQNELKYVATIRKELEPVPALLCHPGQLNQVFLNLLINAGQAITPPGEIVLRSWHDDDFVYASVGDSGEGIPVEIRERIFDPFFTTKDLGKGTGLGLSISYEIIKKHNGRIQVESTVGMGTTFTVALPRNGEEI